MDKVMERFNKGREL